MIRRRYNIVPFTGHIRHGELSWGMSYFLWTARIRCWNANSATSHYGLTWAIEKVTAKHYAEHPETVPAPAVTPEELELFPELRKDTVNE